MAVIVGAEPGIAADAGFVTADVSMEKLSVSAEINAQKIFAREVNDRKINP